MPPSDAAAPAASADAPAPPPEPPVYDGPEYVPPTHEQASEVFDAVDSGSSEDLQALLDAGVPAGVVDDDGNTPLHKAAEGETECVKLLCSFLDRASGVFEAKNADGNTCLMAAIDYESSEICALLIEAGCLPTAEAVALCHEKDVPEVTTVVTGVQVAAKEVKEALGQGGPRRVSVSGGDNINDFTQKFNNEQQTARRQSCAGSKDVGDDAAAAALLVPEAPDDPLENATDALAPADA